jgi:hypothetical protein
VSGAKPHVELVKVVCTLKHIQVESMTTQMKNKHNRENYSFTLLLSRVVKKSETITEPFAKIAKTTRYSRTLGLHIIVVNRIA